MSFTHEAVDDEVSFKVRQGENEIPEEIDIGYGDYEDDFESDSETEREGTSIDDENYNNRDNENNNHYVDASLSLKLDQCRMDDENLQRHGQNENIESTRQEKRERPRPKHQADHGLHIDQRRHPLQRINSWDVKPTENYYIRPTQTHPVSIARPRSIRNLNPDSFTGKEDFHEYISHFELCAELSGWDLRTKTQMLAFKLKEDARRHYSIRLSQNEKSSYHKLVAALEKKYARKNNQEQCKTKLSTRRRQTGETLQEMADDIWCLVRKAYPQMDTETLDILAFDAFRNAISQDLKIKIFDKDCKTMEEAVNALEQYEALKEANRSTTFQSVRTLQDENNQEAACRSDNMTNSDISRQLNATLKTVLDTVNKQQMEQSKSLRRVHFEDDRNETSPNDSPRRTETRVKQSQSAIQEITCYECGRRGHVRKNCPTRQKDMVCYGCGQQGHMKRMCPTRHSMSRQRDQGQPWTERRQSHQHSRSGNDNPLVC